MGRIIPNEQTWIGFCEDIAVLDAPTAIEIGTAIDLTRLCIQINASSQGNTVPTPSLDSLFETSVPGTSTATFTADFYRDDDPAKDLAWDTLLRGVQGFFVISRFGTGGAPPAALAKVEVWPVYIVSRTAGPLTSSTVQMFTCTASVPEQPAEDAVVT